MTPDPLEGPGFTVIATIRDSKRGIKGYEFVRNISQAELQRLKAKTGSVLETILTGRNFKGQIAEVIIGIKDTPDPDIHGSRRQYFLK